MARRNQFRPSLGLNLSQRLAMTPSLLQKIELLTLNKLELSNLLNAELVQNPVLEEVVEIPDPEVERQEDEGPDENDDFDYEYFFEEYLGPRAPSREWESSDDRPSFELFLSHPPTLCDHLNWQLNLSQVPLPIRETAYFIIGNIDEDGYLEMSCEEIAGEMETSLEIVEQAIRLVQSFDPPGVGARDLQECLLIQIRLAGLEGTLTETLVQEYLEDVEAKRFEQLSQALGCPLQEISEALEVIRSLCPRPGQKYSSREPVYIQPDVFIYKVGDDYQIMMNDEDIPRLRLSRAYRALLRRGNVSRETKSFIKARFRSAVELLRSLDQRQQTIYRVCQAIVERQRGFLDNGIMHLKPMLIKDVAEELEVHSSTISRVVANKYAHTPQGVLELRKFFTIGIEGAAGEAISVVHVKEKIRKIIEGESSERPLSDQKIAGLLNSDGIQITRRTVAKYRDQMKIPGSRERKKLNGAA